MLSLRVIFSKRKNFKWRQLFKFIFAPNQLVLALYGFFAPFSFIYLSYVSQGFNVFTTITGIILILISLGLMFFVMFLCQNYSFRVVVIPIFPPSLILWRIIVLTKLNLEASVRSKFYGILTILFISFFNFIIYSEKIANLKNNNDIELMHRRYLQYLQSFIWLIISVLLAYCAWKFTLPLSDPKHSPNSSWLIQLAFIISIGIILIGYAFHVKLRQIEQVQNEQS